MTANMAQAPQQCDSCGQIREQRPYGPPGKTMICVECATTDPEMAEVCARNFILGLTGPDGGPYPQEIVDATAAIMGAVAPIVFGDE